MGLVKGSSNRHLGLGSLSVDMAGAFPASGWFLTPLRILHGTTTISGVVAGRSLKLVSF